MDLGSGHKEFQLQHSPIRSFVHLIQHFAFDLLRSQLKFSASYPKYGFVSNYKRDLVVKLCRMLLSYQPLHQDKHQKICRSREL